MPPRAVHGAAVETSSANRTSSKHGKDCLEIRSQTKALKSRPVTQGTPFHITKGCRAHRLLSRKVEGTGLDRRGRASHSEDAPRRSEQSRRWQRESLLKHGLHFAFAYNLILTPSMSLKHVPALTPSHALAASPDPRFFSRLL